MARLKPESIIALFLQLTNMSTIDAAIIKVLSDHVATTAYELVRDDVLLNLKTEGNDYVLTENDLVFHDYIHPGSTVLKLTRKDNKERGEWFCYSCQVRNSVRFSYYFIDMKNPVIQPNSDGDNILIVTVLHNKDGSFKWTFKDFAKTYEIPSYSFYRIKFTDETGFWNLLSLFIEHQSTVVGQLWDHVSEIWNNESYELH